MNRLARLLGSASGLMYSHTSEKGYSFIRYGALRSYNISNAEIAREIFKRTDAFHKSRIAQTILERGLGNGLLTDHGPTWKPASRLIRPLVTPGASNDLDQIIIKQTNALGQKWKKSAGPVNIDEEMRFLTADIICKALFGSVLPRRPAEAMQFAVGILNSPRFPSQMELVLHKNLGFPIKSIEKVSEAEVKALSYLNFLIDMQIDHREKNPRDVPADILDHLMAYRDESGKGYDRKQIQDHVITLLLAGHETTAVGLTYAIREMAKRPDIAEELHDEAQRVTGGGALEPSHLMSLKRASQVFLEALRLHSPVHATSRECIESAEIGGIRFKKGDLVRIDLNAMNLDPARWEKPFYFNPDRFEKKGLLGQVFLPFAAGERVCPGQMLSLREGVATLASVCRNVRLFLHSDSERKLYGLTSRPDPRTPILVYPQPREPA